MRTRLTDILEIEHPVMLAGMGGVSYKELVAAVSEAGGFGCIGAATLPIEQMVEEIDGVKALTSKPFGVDLLTAMPGSMIPQVQKIIEGGASVFVADFASCGLAVRVNLAQKPAYASIAANNPQPRNRSILREFPVAGVPNPAAIPAAQQSATDGSNKSPK